MRLRRIFRSTNWKYAFGEVLLLFIGITIAIWFNNWNEAKKERQVEIKSLQEVHEGIGQDLLDIEENIAGFGSRVVMYRSLLKHIDEDLPLTDTLSSLLPYIRGLTTFLTNSAPYETLKSRGLDIIKNDSLRIRIADYYDVEYERVITNEKDHHEHVRNYIKPMLLKHFIMIDFRPTPIDFKQMKQDFEFQQVIRWALETDSYMLKVYKDIQDKGLSLQKAIKKEMHRLK